MGNRACMCHSRMYGAVFGQKFYGIGQAGQVEVVSDNHNMQLDVLEDLRVCGALLGTEFGSVCNHVLALALTNAVECDETTHAEGGQHGLHGTRIVVCVELQCMSIDHAREL